MKQYFHHFINGNNDYDWKDIDLFSYSGYRFLLIHGHQYWSWNETKWYEKLREFGVTNKADIVIFGHSHKDFIDTTHKPFLFNPGSISLPRKASFEKSYGIIEIDDKQNLKFKIKFA
jgi:putative phosphoesterase